MKYTSRDIEILEGLEGIRRRPAMYIGEATPERTSCSRLVESIVGNVAAGPPSPSAVRLILWSGAAMTVAFDGEPLPIEMREHPGGVPHPELYAMFMSLAAPGSPLRLGAAILCALSERLAVSTVHAGERYRAVFRRGGLYSLLAKTQTEETLGSSWMTFIADASVVPGVVDLAEAERIVMRAKDTAANVSLGVVDRSTEKADWW